jgi:hypothetical protein
VYVRGDREELASLSSRGTEVTRTAYARLNARPRADGADGVPLVKDLSGSSESGSVDDGDSGLLGRAGRLRRRASV